MFKIVVLINWFDVQIDTLYFGEDVAEECSENTGDVSLSFSY